MSTLLNSLRVGNYGRVNNLYTSVSPDWFVCGSCVPSNLLRIDWLSVGVRTSSCTMDAAKNEVREVVVGTAGGDEVLDNTHMDATTPVVQIADDENTVGGDRIQTQFVSMLARLHDAAWEAVVLKELCKLDNVTGTLSKIKSTGRHWREHVHGHLMPDKSLWHMG